MQNVNQLNPSLSLREQMELILREAIQQGQFRVGEKLPTVRELAEAYGMSKSTVANAIATLSREGLLTSRPHLGTVVAHPPRCERMPVRKTGTVAMLYQGDDSVSRPYYFEVCNSLLEAARNMGWEVSLYPCGDGDEKVIEQLAAVNDDVNTAGVIYFASNVPGDELSAALRMCSRELVLIDHFDPDLRSDSIMIDNVNGALEAVRYLIRAGHRRIGFINSFARSPSAVERQAAYRMALEEAGLPFDEEMVLAEMPYIEGGRDGLQKLLKYEPTAVFTFSDPMALGVIQQAEVMGLRVPDDLSVIGFGGEARGMGVSQTPTTVRVDTREMGYAAIERLLARIQGVDESPRKLLANAWVEEGQTTAEPGQTNDKFTLDR